MLRFVLECEDHPAEPRMPLADAPLAVLPPPLAFAASTRTRAATIEPMLTSHADSNGQVSTCLDSRVTEPAASGATDEMSAK